MGTDTCPSALASARLVGAPRPEVLRDVATRLGLDPGDVEESLYADLPGERLLAPGTASWSPAELIERYNLCQLQGLLFLPERVRARVRDGARSVLRFAKLQRLLVEVHATQDAGPDILLTPSGPLSLLRLTTKYGHAMARWLPALTRQPPWSLRARCQVGDSPVLVRATRADPIGTTHALPRRFDSRLEVRFFRDFSRLASPCEILREAAPVAVFRFRRRIDAAALLRFVEESAPRPAGR